MQVQLARVGVNASVSLCTCPERHTCNIAPAEAKFCTIQQFQNTGSHNGCWITQTDLLTIASADSTCKFVCFGIVENEFCEGM